MAKIAHRATPIMVSLRTMKAGYCRPCQVVFPVESRDIFAASVFCPRCLQRQEEKTLAKIETQQRRHPEAQVLHSLLPTESSTSSSEQ